MVRGCSARAPMVSLRLHRFYSRMEPSLTTLMWRPMVTRRSFVPVDVDMVRRRAAARPWRQQLQFLFTARAHLVTIPSPSCSASKVRT